MYIEDALDPQLDLCDVLRLGHSSQLRAALAELGREDIMIVVGGVIPPQDHAALIAAGATDIYPPGTVIAEAAAALLTKLGDRLGHFIAAAE